MNRNMDWRAKPNSYTVTSETAWKIWEKITNIYHVDTEFQKILAQFLKKTKASLK